MDKRLLATALLSILAAPIIVPKESQSKYCWIPNDGIKPNVPRVHIRLSCIDEKTNDYENVWNTETNKWDWNRSEYSNGIQITHYMVTND